MGFHSGLGNRWGWALIGGGGLLPQVFLRSSLYRELIMKGPPTHIFWGGGNLGVSPPPLELSDPPPTSARLLFLMCQTPLHLHICPHPPSFSKSAVFSLFFPDGPNDRIQAVLNANVAPRLIELLMYAFFCSPISPPPSHFT